MNYTRKSFNGPMTKVSDENWERTFGKKPTAAERRALDAMSRQGGVYMHTLDEKARVKEAVPVSGVWLRTRCIPKSTDQNSASEWDEIEVLVEIEGQWRCIQKHTVLCLDQTISHITENAGMRNAPKDLL